MRLRCEDVDVILGETVGGTGNDGTLHSWSSTTTAGHVCETLKQPGKSLPGVHILGASSPILQIRKKEGLGMVLIGALPRVRNGEPRKVHARLGLSNCILNS